MKIIMICILMFTGYSTYAQMINSSGIPIKVDITLLESHTETVLPGILIFAHCESPVINEKCFLLYFDDDFTKGTKISIKGFLNNYSMKVNGIVYRIIIYDKT